MIWLDPASACRSLSPSVSHVAASSWCGRRRELVRRVAFGGAALASAITGLTAVAALRSGVAVHGLFFVHHASGFSLDYSIDPLSAWFLIVLSVLAVPIAIFSIGYARHPPLDGRSVFLGIAFNVLLFSVELVFVAGRRDCVPVRLGADDAGDGGAGRDRVRESSRRAGRPICTWSCHTWRPVHSSPHSSSSRPRRDRSRFRRCSPAESLSGPPRDVVFLLFFLGFGVKAGIIPLHVWLPEAHPAAPSGISALMSGVLIKTGIYGIVRFCAFGLGTPPLSWGVLVLVVGALSAVLGVLYALMQHDLKRLLAYHSIENIGIILLGVGAGMIALAGGQPGLAAVGIAAGLYHVLNHAVFKGLLFLSAGSLVVATGTRQIEEFGGLLRRMPWTGACFLVGAVAISGLPPFNGFASEWLAFQALLHGFQASTEPLVHLLFPVAAALLALTGALAAACFVKAFGITLPGLAAEPPRRRRPMRPARACSRRRSCWPRSVSLLGVFPGAVLTALSAVMVSLPGLQPPPEMIRGPLGMAATAGPSAAVTPGALALALLGGLGVAALLVRGDADWLLPFAAHRRGDAAGCCGPRTEYTATAFSKPLMMIFRAVYRPTREVEALAKVSPYFPQEVRYHVEIEPTFERYVYGPLTDTVLRVADRLKILQAGQPARVSRLRDRPRLESRAHGVVEQMR